MSRSRILRPLEGDGGDVLSEAARGGGVAYEDVKTLSRMLVQQRGNVVQEVISKENMAERASE